MDRGTNTEKKRLKLTVHFTYFELALLVGKCTGAEEKHHRYVLSSPSHAPLFERIVSISSRALRRPGTFTQKSHLIGPPTECMGHAEGFGLLGSSGFETLDVSRK